MDPRTGKGLGLHLAPPFGGYAPVGGYDQLVVHRTGQVTPRRYATEHAIGLAQLCRDASLAQQALGGALTPIADQQPLAATWPEPEGQVEAGQVALGLTLEKQLCQVPGEALNVGFALGAACVLNHRLMVAPAELCARALSSHGQAPGAPCQLDWALQAFSQHGGQPYDYIRRCANGPPTASRQLSWWQWLPSAAAVRAAMTLSFPVVIGYRWHARDHVPTTTALPREGRSAANGRHAVPWVGLLANRGPAVGWQVQAAWLWSDDRQAIRLLAQYGRALPSPWLHATRLDAWLQAGEAEAVALTHWVAPVEGRRGRQEAEDA